MRRTLPCPECGEALDLSGLTPNRQVRCPACRKWVEIPVLPRMARQEPGLPVRPVRRRQGKPTGAIWAYSGAALAVALILVVATLQLFKVQARNVHEREINRLIEVAQQEEREKQLGSAQVTIDAALAEAARIEPRDDTLLDKLRKWRDRIVRRDVQGQLAAAARLTPEQAAGVYRALLSRIHADASLEGFQHELMERIDRANESWAEADLTAARHALDAGNVTRVLELCERLVANTNTLATDRRRRIRAEADALAALIIPRRGVILDPVKGHYSLGTDSSYAPVVGSKIAEGLRQHGFVVRPASSFWEPLWDQQSPYHLRFAVIERLAGPYPQSKNRISFMDVRIYLDQKGKPKPIWEGLVNARTRVPSPKLKTHKNAGRTLSGLRDPAIEQLLYEDARGVLVEKIAQQLTTLPELREPLAPPGPTAAVP